MIGIYDEELSQFRMVYIYFPKHNCRVKVDTYEAYHSIIDYVVENRVNHYCTYVC